MHVVFLMFICRLVFIYSIWLAIEKCVQTNNHQKSKIAGRRAANLRKLIWPCAFWVDVVAAGGPLLLPFIGGGCDEDCDGGCCCCCCCCCCCGCCGCDSCVICPAAPAPAPEDEPAGVTSSSIPGTGTGRPRYDGNSEPRWTA